MAVVITDGKSRNMLRTLIEASRAKRNSVHLFAIGVGHAVNYRELSRMASHPPSEYFFQVAGYSALDSLKKILAIKTCQGEAGGCLIAGEVRGIGCPFFGIVTV